MEAIAKAEMLIRRPVTEVFAAFTDPAITSKFWFSKGSAPLEEGKQVQWDWEMYGFSTQIWVKALEQDKRILLDWGAYNAPTTVEWIFTPFDDDSTFVSITNKGFVGSDEEQVKQAIGSTEGFTLVLAGLKALLEHNIQLNLVPDRFSAGLKA